jgi:hypothetical protein
MVMDDATLPLAEIKKHLSQIVDLTGDEIRAAHLGHE